MKTLVCWLEEASAKEMLEGVLPRLLPDGWCFRCIHFKGKQDLEKQLMKRLRGWLTPDTYFLVLRDKDASDCMDVKNKLVSLCREAGRPNALVRIACRELESFYLGDLQAVEKGLSLSGISQHQNKAKFRNPDNLGNPAEELIKLTSGIYQKMAGSRAIAPYLDLENNKSHSFAVLISGLKRFVE